jgi:conjugal transfer mating pair stabilization protein TraN
MYEATYSCPVAGETYTTASNCPSNVFCLGTSCFNTAYTNDTDFARSMSMLEAAREAGVYLDTDRMTVFSGESRFCRERLLKNCCSADSTGAGMSNQSLYGTGSALVFDTLMSGQNFDYVRQGLTALLSSSGWSGSAGMGAYGISVEFFAGDAVVTTTGEILYSGAITESTGMVIAFDPWTLVIAVVIAVVMAALECNPEEAKTALSEGARLCHAVGTWCSRSVLGSCITRTTGKCCFNSVLARIINEQGRVQVGKGWAGPQSPDCSGFTIAQLQSLNFALMDFSEFYASLVAKSPNLSNLQSNNANRIPSCYYGQGKC